MIANESRHDAPKRVRLHGRTKAPKVFRPDSPSVVVTVHNADRYFIQIAGISATEEASVDLHKVIIAGVPLESVNRIKAALKIQKDELLSYLDISSATFNRRMKRDKKLTGRESGQVYRYARLLALATNLFHGDKDEALRWLKAPAYAFKGETPLAHARTEYGNNEVETLIGRMEHGIPS